MARQVNQVLWDQWRQRISPPLARYAELVRWRLLERVEVCESDATAKIEESSLTPCPSPESGEGGVIRRRTYGAMRPRASSSLRPSAPARASERTPTLWRARRNIHRPRSTAAARRSSAGTNGAISSRLCLANVNAHHLLAPRDSDALLPVRCC
jgi:hypothetical protein